MQDRYCWAILCHSVVNLKAAMTEMVTYRNTIKVYFKKSTSNCEGLEVRGDYT